MEQRFVLDTSVFTNPDVYRQFASDPLAAVAEFLALAERTRACFYMPTSVYSELRRMRDLDGVAPDFERIVRIRSPRRFQLQIPAELIYELIEELRARIDSGLRIAEEHAKMGRDVVGAEDAGRLIGRLRERYRETLRRGIIDSREDVDVLLLAFELEAALVSADEGLRKWADKVGVEVLFPRHLGQILRGLVIRAEAAAASAPAASAPDEAEGL